MHPILYFLDSLSFLGWWLLASALGIADVFILRRWLLMPAAAAGIVGFVLMLYPQIGWPWQSLGFLAITAAGIVMRGLRGAKSRIPASVKSTGAQEKTMGNFHDFKLKTIDGKDKQLKDFQGQVVLTVNVASECGLTPQYAGLEKLYREFKDKGLVVLGVPCNQFGQQEPGTEAQIQQFCSLNYQVSFPLTGKIEVNGQGAHPLYAWLKGESGGADIQWNFEKFLIGRDGKLIRRYSPKTVPEDPRLRTDLQSAL